MAAGPGEFQGQLAYPTTVTWRLLGAVVLRLGTTPAAGDGSAVIAEPPSARGVSRGSSTPGPTTRPHAAPRLPYSGTPPPPEPAPPLGRARRPWSPSARARRPC